jgi:SAM-dependent methyltransferase
MGVFDDYYRNNSWGNDESVSGHGSSLQATSAIRSVLPLMFDHYDIGSVLDIPCGDFYWISHIVKPGTFHYIGADVVPELIDEVSRKHKGFDFRVLDITKDSLPKSDLVFCRDLFGHLPNYKIQAALRNIRRSGSKYLLTTTFPEHHNSGDIAEGQWRPINMAEFWGLGNPLEVINEHCQVPEFADKALGLWRLK